MSLGPWLVAANSASPFGDSSRLGRPFAKDPSVIAWGGGYLMYYSMPAFDPALAKAESPKGWGVGIAFSADLLDWKKIGEFNASATGPEAQGIAAPCALVIGGKVHLFYQTYGSGARDAICHAVSKDGIRFERNSSNPVFRPRASWSVGRAIDAELVIFKGRLLMYFATRDLSYKIQEIGVASAAVDSDYSASAWTELSNDRPVMKPELPWEKSCIEAPSVCERGGRLFMFYAGGYNNEPQQIGAAVSDDGLSWKRLSDQPLLPNGIPGTWNESESGHPGIFIDRDGSTRLFFQGNNDKGRTWKISSIGVRWDEGLPSVDVEGPR